MLKRAALFVFIVIFGTLLAAAARSAEAVSFSGFAPGTIVVMTGARQLYYVVAPGRALRYPVGVGRAGMAWHGQATVAIKLLRPAWAPPADIARANPRLPGYIPGGSPRNPMGAAALGLDRGDYAIHGTNDPASIGGFVSHGCIRMHNADILDLYRRVPLGTRVVVLR
jgi:lipoprotein-anchoring transpeptidase ErfK/SrfK